MATHLYSSGFVSWKGMYLIMSNEDLYVKIYKALAHPIRIKIVKSLLDGPLCVCILNENVEFSQSNLSQHLKILKDAGVLKSEKDGLRILYSIKDDEIKNLLKVTEQIIRNELIQMNNKFSDD
jgi:ArsR family transcriptional regulator